MKLENSSQSVTGKITLIGSLEGLVNILGEGEGLISCRIDLQARATILWSDAMTLFISVNSVEGGRESFLPSDLMIIYLLFYFQIRKKKVLCQ